MSELKSNRKPLIPEMEHFGFKEGRHHYWWASWYAEVLGYESLKTLRRSIQKAKAACVQLGLSFEENFIEDAEKKDIKLSKFGCFLIALQADTRKPVVKKARSYFYNEMNSLDSVLNKENYMARYQGRQEIKILNNKLVRDAARNHVTDIQHFMNEGYMGMYDKSTTDIRRDRGLSLKANLYDFMSMAELSANIFRITLTSERLKLLRNPSAQKAAYEHWKVGAQIRAMIKNNLGTYPEGLPVKEDLNKLRSILKSAQKVLNDEVKIKNRSHLNP